MKFKKKPVVIEAVKVEKGMLDDAPMWLHDAERSRAIDLFEVGGVSTNAPWARVNTLEGVMVADEGDWIIRGVKGELYPCKPDIFEATYEPVEEA